MMKPRFLTPTAMSLAALLASASSFAASAKTYQVTGPITDVTDKTITVQKGKEKWEINRTADTKVDGELKAGAKATIIYEMTATDVTVKGGEGATEGKGKSKKK